MRSETGKWMLVTGLMLIVASVVTGHLIQPSLVVEGLEGYTINRGPIGWSLFFLFAFGFPLGAGLTLMGTVTSNGIFGLRLRWLMPIVLTGVFSAWLVPRLLGGENDAWFFGVGGYTITLLFIATIWYWGKRRKRLPAQARLGADFQGISYMFFIMAAWNLCGVGGAPSFLLQPERAIELRTLAFAAAQMKTVMVLLVLGWLFLLLGYVKLGYRSELPSPCTDQR